MLYINSWTMRTKRTVKHTGKKKSIHGSIQSAVSAHILFLSDRTCCVCRSPGKPVQIHHLDGNPRNNSTENLSVLCFDCHRETQIRGGFDRKLDSEQVVLYRNDWHALVAARRASQEAMAAQADAESNQRLELVTSLAEIYRQNEEYQILAYHYDSIGNHELRDKYIEVALSKDGSDEAICALRSLQGKPELIPKEVMARELDRYKRNKDWSQRARFYFSLGRRLDSLRDYLRTATEDVKRGNVFAAAFYLKEMVERGLIRDLFMEALSQAKNNGDLWWQVRALQELGHHEELRAFLEQNAEEIEKSGNTFLQRLLAEVHNDSRRIMELAKYIAQGTKIVRLNYKEGEAKMIVKVAGRKIKRGLTPPSNRSQKRRG
jgi:hypothetical protein